MKIRRKPQIVFLGSDRISPAPYAVSAAGGREPVPRCRYSAVSVHSGAACLNETLMFAIRGKPRRWRTEKKSPVFWPDSIRETSSDAPATNSEKRRNTERARDLKANGPKGIYTTDSIPVEMRSSIGSKNSMTQGTKPVYQRTRIIVTVPRSITHREFHPVGCIYISGHERSLPCDISQQI